MRNSTTVFPAILFYLLLRSLTLSWAYFGVTSREQVVSLTLNLQTFTDNRFSGSDLPLSNKLCEMMKLHRKQKKMCRRGKGIAHALMESIRTSVVECQFQFKDERWNCSLEDPYRQNLLRKGFKETSFLHALSSASLVHTFARACSRGRIDRCTCDESKNFRNEEAWRWGGCGDNMKFGLKFTRRFLRRAKRRGKDVREKINKHNSRVGIKVIKNNVQTKCKCHGVSGSCTVRTCWLQLSPFHVIGQQLKRKYEEAFRVETNTNSANGRYSLTIRPESSNLVTSNTPPSSLDMVYLDNSPNFCKRSKYSEGTSGRECRKNTTCHSICCGRGYNVMTKTIFKSCQCQVIWCCDLNCQRCLREEEVYTCK